MHFLEIFETHLPSQADHAFFFIVETRALNTLHAQGSNLFDLCIILGSKAALHTLPRGHETTPRALAAHFHVVKRATESLMHQVLQVAID
jgi:hypothetical protein